MRQFKFRAWSTASKKFYYRVLVGNTENDDPCSSIWDEAEETWKEFDKFCGIIQQYTGLKDTKGVEIYEGDIVEGEWYDEEYHHTEKKTSEVVYSGHYACFNIGSRNWIRSSLKVVGNVFETPELLK